jgi:hypothetical protein
MAYGTLSTLDVLESTQQSVVEFGVQAAWESVRVTLEAHNRMVDQMAGELWVPSTDTRRAYGGGSTKVMEELDQFGAPSAQKIAVGVTLDFPLRRYGSGIQWTRQSFEMMSGAQLAADVQAMLSADQANIIRAAKTALYTATNYTFVDYLGRPAGVSLAVKALINADSSDMPVGPNGETFNGATHTHYLANATLTATVVTNLVTTIQEHYSSGTPILVISSTDEAAFRALSGFIADVDARIIQPGGGTTQVTNQAANMANLYDRRIGIFGAAEVWIKPWAIANYILAYMRGQVPLVMRQPVFAPAGQLRLVSDTDGHPLFARTYERQFGMGVWQRTAAAVLYFANATYTSPTIS